MKKKSVFADYLGYMREIDMCGNVLSSRICQWIIMFVAFVKALHGSRCSVRMQVGVLIVAIVDEPHGAMAT